MPILQFSLVTGPVKECAGRNGLDKVRNTGKGRGKLCLLLYLRGPVGQQILFEFLPCAK